MSAEDTWFDSLSDAKIKDIARRSRDKMQTKRTIPVDIIKVLNGDDVDTVIGRKKTCLQDYAR